MHFLTLKKSLMHVHFMTALLGSIYAQGLSLVHLSAFVFWLTGKTPQTTWTKNGTVGRVSDNKNKNTNKVFKDKSCSATSSHISV